MVGPYFHFFTSRSKSSIGPINFYNINDFITQAINDEAKDAERFIHVVLGNESGDLDSVVSAVIYAYFLQKQVRI